MDWDSAKDMDGDESCGLDGRRTWYWADAIRPYGWIGILPWTWIWTISVEWMVAAQGRGQIKSRQTLGGCDPPLRIVIIDCSRILDGCYTILLSIVLEP